MGYSQPHPWVFGLAAQKEEVETWPGGGKPVILAMGEAETGKCLFKACLGCRVEFKARKEWRWGGVCGSAVESLSSMREALGSTPQHCPFPPPPNVSDGQDTYSLWVLEEIKDDKIEEDRMRA